ncbi:MAG: hypothetical protein ACLPPF_15210 [Rhodomicrobium sp.]
MPEQRRIGKQAAWRFAQAGLDGLGHGPGVACIVPAGGHIDLNGKAMLRGDGHLRIIWESAPLARSIGFAARQNCACVRLREPLFLRDGGVCRLFACP